MSEASAPEEQPLLSAALEHCVALAARSTTDGIVITDMTGRTLWVNPAYERMTGYSCAELQGRSPGALMQGERTDPAVVAFMRSQRRAGQPFHTEVINYRRDGEPFVADINVFSVYDTIGKTSRYVGIVNDITEAKRVEEQIEHLAYHDTLTGLPNRLLFRDRLDVALLQAQRRQNHLALLAIDINRFKLINDSMGHQCGDLLLKEVAERLYNCVRKCDTVSRIGGDEFVLLLPDLIHSDDVHVVAKKVCAILQPAFHIEGRDIYLTLSLGASVYPEQGQDAETLMRQADIAMHEAKSQGRNSFQIFRDDLNRQASEHLALESGLHEALATDGLRVYYQPLVDLLTGRIVGMEALARWPHPVQGMVGPDRFIPVAEESGLIVPLGAWVMRTACAQLQAWRQAGHEDLHVGVNLSLRQFQQTNLVAQIAEILAETGLPPACLDLEITESLAMDAVEARIATLRELKALGIRLSLDDFGTGYSSLNYLKLLPIDTVKIDRSFMHMTTTDPRDAAIAQAIIAMAHTLHLRVVAEGIDDPAQLAFLRQERCDLLQGFLFSKPVPAEEMGRLLRENVTLETVIAALPKAA